MINSDLTDLHKKAGILKVVAWPLGRREERRLRRKRFNFGHKCPFSRRPKGHATIYERQNNIVILKSAICITQIIKITIITVYLRPHELAIRHTILPRLPTPGALHEPPYH
jgi:hypothetical protein